MGYVFGLFCAIFASVYFRLAQPALLYLVPCQLVPVSVLGLHRGQLATLWLGPKRAKLAPGGAELQGADESSKNLEV